MNERAERAIIRNAIKGLVITAKEMACQTSVEDAKDEIARMKDMAVELADFWNIDDDVEEMFADELGRVMELYAQEAYCDIELNSDPRFQLLQSAPSKPHT